jgi:hypothetical protein
LDPIFPSGVVNTLKYKRDKVNASLALSNNTVSSVDNMKSLKASQPSACPDA